MSALPRDDTPFLLHSFCLSGSRAFVRSEGKTPRQHAFVVVVIGIDRVARSMESLLEVVLPSHRIRWAVGALRNSVLGCRSVSTVHRIFHGLMMMMMMMMMMLRISWWHTCLYRSESLSSISSVRSGYSNSMNEEEEEEEEEVHWD